MARHLRFEQLFQRGIRDGSQPVLRNELDDRIETRFPIHPAGRRIELSGTGQEAQRLHSRLFLRQRGQRTFAPGVHIVQNPADGRRSGTGNRILDAFKLGPENVVEEDLGRPLLDGFGIAQDQAEAGGPEDDALLDRTVGERIRIEFFRSASPDEHAARGTVEHGEADPLQVRHAAVDRAHQAVAQARRQGVDRLGDLGRPPALVHVADGLVVDVLVEIALRLEIVDDRLPAPHRPVVLTDQDPGLGPVEGDRVGDVFRPDARIARNGAAQRNEVVQERTGVLRHVEHAEVGIEHVHLGRRLGLRRELEHDLHAVDRVFLDRLHDELRRLDQARRAARHGLAETRRTGDEGEAALADQLLGAPATFRGVIFDTASTSTLHALLAARHAALPEVRVGLVHGRMAAAEKAAVMEAFKANALQVLVADIRDQHQCENCPQILFHIHVLYNLD